MLQIVAILNSILLQVITNVWTLFSHHRFVQMDLGILRKRNHAMVSSYCKSGSRGNCIIIPNYSMSFPDINECLEETDNCNDSTQICLNTRGSFVCQNKVSEQCLPGFKYDKNKKTCQGNVLFPVAKLFIRS